MFCYLEKHLIPVRQVKHPVAQNSVLRSGWQNWRTWRRPGGQRSKEEMPSTRSLSSRTSIRWGNCLPS